MTETRIVHDPFLGRDVKVSDALVDRLRGKYAQGPTLPSGEPEFGWRQFPVPPIHLEAADEIERLRAALESLVNAEALSSVRAIVAGWNGEGRTDGPFQRHPSRLGAMIPKTTCGAVYALDEAMQHAKLVLSNPGAGGPLSAPDVVDDPQSSRQEPAPKGCPGGAGSLCFVEITR